MISTLIVTGILIMILSFISGIITHSFIGFLMAMTVGIALAIIYFALTRILENQDDILYKLQDL